MATLMKRLGLKCSPKNREHLMSIESYRSKKIHLTEDFRCRSLYHHWLVCKRKTLVERDMTRLKWLMKNTNHQLNPWHRPWERLWWNLTPLSPISLWLSKESTLHTFLTRRRNITQLAWPANVSLNRSLIKIRMTSLQQKEELACISLRSSRLLRSHLKPSNRLRKRSMKVRS